ncbi:MAG: 1-acyl-sn-glycerol-3-phosphate acyltransferase [Eubacteriales bacterium]|nr:1-acyl-sn-glycerol-3-phosphate acyltransferase [Eubacteriales bacterium]
MKDSKVRYYKEFTDDFEQTREQDMKLPEDYEYIRRDFFSKLKYKLVYTCAVIFGIPYCKLFLRVKYVNKKVLKKAKDTGFFIYGNHTQPLGDVFLPALPSLPKRIYTVVSPANFAIPVIGKLLPYLGALPISDTATGMKKFTEALSERIEEGKVVTIYPEAHVWEYFTEIRPFAEASFRYPVKLKKPVFTMTVTYQKSKVFRRPKSTVYIDGPFYADETLKPRLQSKDLCERVYECMKERSKASNYSYIKYKKTD